MFIYYNMSGGSSYATAEHAQKSKSKKELSHKNKQDSLVQLFSRA